MKITNYNYFVLSLWVFGLLTVGYFLGSLTQANLEIWYRGMERSSLTPPDYIFGIAWTILYTILGYCGWLLWSVEYFPVLYWLQLSYAGQMVLNWLWTPLFFSYHLTGLALLVLQFMHVLVGIIIYFSYEKIRLVSYLMVPYLLWLLFAAYLNFYVWFFN